MYKISSQWDVSVSVVKRQLNAYYLIVLPGKRAVMMAILFSLFIRDAEL
jgi:hypothetical protein